MENQITLVATDLDGTFLDSKKEVSDLNRQAVSKLKEKGIMFGIASGRPIETVRAMLKKWQIEDSVSFIVGMNGGVIYDCRQQEKDEYHLIDGSLICEIMDHYSDMDVVFQVLVGDLRYVNISTPETRAHAKLFGETEIQVDLYEFLENRTVNKLIICCQPEYMPKVIERSQTFSNEKYVCFKTADNLFEYCDPAINKGYGIKKLCKHYGVLEEHCMAFGDEGNDKQMLEVVGVGVAMKNASDDVKQSANYVSEYTNDESALGHFLFDHVLKEEES